MHRFRLSGILLLLAVAGMLHAAEPVSKPAPQELTRTNLEIKVDGELTDDGWKKALVIDRFYETSPGDNIPAKVGTKAMVTYDDAYFYIGIIAEDPEAHRIRAPFVERDQVLGTDDNVAIFIDARNDGKNAIEFRVNPRGIQGDAIFDDVSSVEDFSPDFFYDTAARITDRGWEAELRIPLTTLRYPKTDPQTWRILVWRNYPRDFRYAFHSAPIERGSNCLVCHAHELTGISGLPTSRHLVVAPYGTGSHLRSRSGSNEEFDGESDGEVGVDVKWNPTANSAIDATINPDFSQVESDVPQIAVNQRFALFFPEKRPFFLEGSDLFNTPVQLVYTRTITDPDWGARATGKMGNTSYTVLSGRDQGGGLVVLPGPVFSDFAVQDFESYVTLGRVRHDFGNAFGSFMLTDREIEGGGHNRVLGPDGQWRPTPADIITGQFLFSSTEDPVIPDTPFSGASGNSHAGHVTWDHNVRDYDWRIRYNDVGEDFRADVGFVPQAGYRQGLGSAGWRFYPTGKFLNFVRIYGVAEKSWFSDGDDLGHDYFPGIFLIGSRNLNAEFEFHDNSIAVDDQMLNQKYFSYFVQFDPSRRLPRITFFGRVGDSIDFENAREGTGTNFTLSATVRPFSHLTLIADAAREWLDLDVQGSKQRLYTANIARIKGVYVFDSRHFIRAIGQYVSTDRDPLIYDFPVQEKSGTFLGSILYGYRLNWQTVLFVGYGDNGLVNQNDSFIHTDRSFFIKVSYAWQH